MGIDTPFVQRLQIKAKTSGDSSMVSMEQKVKRNTYLIIVLNDHPEYELSSPMRQKPIAKT